MTFVIAADGGNSKTDLVVAAADGAVLARVTGAGTRPYINGLPATAAGLAELARAGLVAAGLAPDARAAIGSFYLANVDFDDEEAAMFAALTALRVADRLEVCNDTLAVLKAGCSRGWGIAVVGGAGINAVGRYPDGRQERFLGIGEMSGDWGGGQSVAVAAFGAAVRAGDRRGPDTALRALVASTFGRDPDSAAIAANRGEITDAELFAFAPAVFQVAADGDAVAVAIVERFADEVLSFVAALIRRMELAESDVDVVLGGGTLQSRQPQLLARISAGLTALAPRATLHVLDVAPVVGPLVSALALAGAEPAAIERARSSLRA
ncbi:MAG TPA: BadF/BadG/BcrA/BcrD ATPase family protein [Jatrophihabitantaceae bacterium]|jgi:N-acetylglucosamine kinase-like BadF-type ATPase|nr:BadF/BadG/BcrA/BcrD ATPase family protein [Jatrophihabitantaceae bacterium]